MSSCRQTLLGLVVLAGACLAGTGRAAADEVRGVIAGVDAAKNELRVEARGRNRGTTVTLTLDEKTLVLFGSEKATAADLQTGRRVRVEFDGGPGGQRIARVVRSAGRPPAAPVTAKPGPTVPGATGADAVSGVLQRVARTDREVVVIGPGAKGPETETTVAVPETAKVVKEGKPSSLDGLKEGDAVAIRVERRAGRLTALEVQAGPGAALSAGPAPERSQMVPRIRQALHMADEVLKRLEPEDPGSKKP